jgi:predicted NACHT family NTPase
VLNTRIPFVMVLREMSLDRVLSWDDLLASYFEHWTARHFGRPRYAYDVSKLLESGRALIILDGLDEVGNPKVQKNLRQAVWEGIRRYKDCAWLLTSRVVGYLDYQEGPDPEAQGGGDDTIFSYAQLRYVAPFADHQIKKFAQNWFATRDQSAIRASEDANRLEQAIHTNPYTLRLARIPNLLMMMALIHRERARLPHGRALLYTDIANAYLQSIDEHRRIEHLGYSLRDQKQWLAACRIIQQGKIAEIST